MSLEEDIRQYLPKYLSPSSYSEILDELKGFPENIDERMYFKPSDDILYQGDVISDMPIVDMDNLNKGIKHSPALILSNTCDMDLNNERPFMSRIMYAPLISLKKYSDSLLKRGVLKSKIENHINNIKKQQVTSIFFLPKSELFDDSFVFLDRILNIDVGFVDRNRLNECRLSSLGNYGFYLLLFKLSVHFSRMQEGVDRRT